VLLLISSQEGEVERWRVAIEQRLPVLPLFQQREVGWRRWSSAAVPLERILQDQEKTNRFSFSLSRTIGKIKKKKIISLQSLSLSVPLFPIWT
jgi:hypothetical protein